MPSFFSNKRLIFLLVSTILMVVVVGLTLDERPQLTWMEQFTRDSIGFFQMVVYKPAQGVANFFANMNEMKQVYSENQKLKAHLQENAKLMAKIKELETENESLRETQEIQSSLSDFQLRSAQVISRSPDRWYQQVTIDRGEKHGIEPNMAVMTAEGLIGRVNAVSQFTSTVELITNANRAIHISAVVQGEENIYGVIEGYDAEQEALYFRKIPKDAELEEGQTVITSGWGGVFPRGLFIGEIVEMMPDEYGLTQSALIEPAADLYEFQHVLVVERTFDAGEIPPPPEEETDEEDDGGAEAL